MNRIIYTIVLFTFAIQSWAQVNFGVFSPEGEPLIGATARVVSLSNEALSEQLISNSNGIFSSSLSYPLMVEVRFLGFESVKTTINKSGQRIVLLPKDELLDEVVITGQYQAQSVKNSVYKVRSISSDRIQAQNANSVHDVLSNELNIQISRDNATGRSGISLQGLSGQYVKVLVDGVPVIGRGGVSNDIDLSQIDIQTVDKIEIVEGPMAVNYGADALAGVINIITKKDSKNTLDANISIQTETAGDEYELFDEGIYSPSISLGYKWNSNWYSQLNTRYYRFGGWQGNSTGREKDWHPKEQLFTNFLTRYNTSDWEIYYRLEVLDELISDLGAIRTLDNKESRATDEEFHANRLVHQLQSNLSLGNTSLNSIFSYTDYERLSLNYERFLESGAEVPLTIGNDTIFYKSFFTRQTLNNLLSREGFALQVGLEATREIAGGSTLSDGDKDLTEIGVFVSAEVAFHKLKVRPGIRYTYNSAFSTIPTPSINFSYGFSSNTQLRWSYGRGFRAPSVRELYHEFIDTNHNLIGNSNLNPESSHNLNIDLTHQLNDIPIAIEFGGFYNDVSDRIGVTISDDGREQSYTNISAFKSLGLNARINYQQGEWNVASGISRIGRYQQLRELSGVPDFLYAYESTVIVQYAFSAPKIYLATFYKYTGPINVFQTNASDEVEETRQDGFHNLDFNLAKATQNFRFSIGVRNALNVTTLNTTVSGGVHGGGSGVPVGFGRSYFLQINYNFNKTK